MKKLRKIGAIVLAVMMIAAVGLAYATSTSESKILDGDNMTGISDNPNGTNGRANDAFNAVQNTLSLNKSIVFINDDPTNVYEPNITYTYTISKPTLTETNTITDEHDADPAHQVVVYNDYTLANVVTNENQQATVTFADGNAMVAATAAGTEVIKPFTFTFDPTKFTHPGVYRFQIDESVTTNAREIAGIVSNPTYAATRYLDVYVRNDGNGSYEIYGYVLFEANSADTNITEATTKSNGWVNTASSGSTPADVDVYTTYNAYVQKHVSGSMADQTNAFPFDITLANTATVTRTTKIRVQATDSKATVGSGTTTWTGSSDAQTSNAYIALNGSTNVVLGETTSGTTKNTIKHGGEIGLYGIPADTTIMVEETNNTLDKYTASATVKNGTAEAATKNIDYKTNSSAQSYTTNVSSAQLENTGLAKMTSVETITSKKIIDFTNTLTEISPTGYVSRFAPYALILIGGIALLIISKKHKKHTDEE